MEWLLPRLVTGEARLPVGRRRPAPDASPLRLVQHDIFGGMTANKGPRPRPLAAIKVPTGLISQSFQGLPDNSPPQFQLLFRG